MRVGVVLGVRHRAAVVPVGLVGVMSVAIVYEVLMAGVRHAGVAAARAVLMRMLLMLMVHCVHDLLLSSEWRTASSTIRAMCVSTDP